MLQAEARKVYWIDAGTSKIQRANLDGSQVEDVVASGPESRLSSLGVDLAAGKVYWSDLGDKKIRRAGLDGSNPEEVVAASPSGTSLALADGRIFWADLSLKQVLSAKQDGSSEGPEAVVSDLTSPNAVAVDAVGGKVYWGDFGTRKLHRANADGSKSEVVVPYGKNSSGIVVDSLRGKVLWSNFGTNAIYRCSLDGHDMEQVVSGLDNPGAIALDAKAGRIYWVDRGSGKIQRAAMDGSQVEDVVCGLDRPWAVALGPEPGARAAQADAAPSADSQDSFAIGGSVDRATVVIQKYSWADEGDCVKVYVSEAANPAVLAAAGDGKQGQLQTDFQARSFSINVTSLEGGASFELCCRGLVHEVIPEKCKVRVSQGKRISVSLAKKEAQVWSALSAKNW
ncbi:unnamed protein product [Polarella glacialis]|uniref:CS domain-containing protein n=1 Tax=Polarella glacialis TaxID=89957 RepID=A0A813F055_POLGL|nr:unnamed protein product [Polarella glacialis]CAE8648851.1 unnamed protein product [Polarella glacialis]